MKDQELYQELRDLATQVGLPVRIELGDFDGGICTVKDAQLILVNRRHDVPRRNGVIARALQSSGLLEGVFVKPALREAIEDEVAMFEATR